MTNFINVTIYDNETNCIWSSYAYYGISSREKDFLSRKQILSFAQKAEFLGYDSLSVNDHIVFRTSWLDAISTLSAVAEITNKIKLGNSILNIVIEILLFVPKLSV